MELSSILPPRSTEPQAQPIAELRPLGDVTSNLRVGESIRATVVQAGSGTTVLNLKGVQVPFNTVLNVAPGMELLVKVAGLEPQPALQVQQIIPPEAAPTPPASLVVGQDLPAKVLADLFGGRYLLEVQGSQVEATAPKGTGLAPGAEVTVRVAGATPQAVFQILDPAQAFASKAVQVLGPRLGDSTSLGQVFSDLRQALDHQPALSANLARLQNLLATLSPHEGPPTAEGLAQFLNESGLLYEAKLARTAEGNSGSLAQLAQKDLKGALLQVHQETKAAAQAGLEPKSASGPVANLAASVAASLNRIEAQQLVNLLAQLHGEPYFLQVPVAQPQPSATLYLAVEPDSRGKGEDHAGPSGYNLLLQLDLDNLGRTRIDAHFTPTAMRVIFYVEPSPAANRLREELPGFGEQLKSLGYQEVLLTTRQLGQLPAEQQEQFARLETGVPATVSFLDVRV